MIGAFSVFLVKQFMNGVPDELIESAQVDGCPEYRIFIQIVMPLLKPVIVTLVVFTFISAWNDFLWPLIAADRNGALHTDRSSVCFENTVFRQLRSDYGGLTDHVYFPVYIVYFPSEAVRSGIALGGVQG